ncbi:MAG: histone H1-like repetitive region-containing protein, partial [Acidimicrobiia bacterium]
MPAPTKPELFVVDGSNIATEGRTTPSLEQLNEAVLAFMEAHPHATVTVVVDATFGHRIAKKEVKAFDEAVANNELVTPPAGAVGRGDAFVLAIADRAKAGILSNDSFQEFHGEYEWLFDEGRLIGGKPVPHVGWVFVKRSPVRGPKSRQAVREASQDAKATKEQANRRVRKKGAEPAPEPDDETGSASTEPAPSDDAASEPASKDGARRGRRGRGRKKAADAIGPEQQATIEAAKAATAPREHVNDLMPFLEFVEHHPVGTSCTAVIESYSSHGAYARVDDVLVYLPLRLMDEPAPRSARSVLSLGEAITTVIVGYVPDRRSIDVALPHMAGDVVSPDGAQPTDTATDASGAEPAPAKKAAAKKAPAKKTAAKKTAAKKAPAKKAPAKKAAAKKAPAKQTAATEAAEPSVEAAPAAAPAEAAPAKKAAAKKAPAKKTAAKKTAAKKTAAKKTPAKKTPAKKAPAKKAPAKKA